jgi:hypothetical protein
MIAWPYSRHQYFFFNLERSLDYFGLPLSINFDGTFREEGMFRAKERDSYSTRATKQGLEQFQRSNVFLCVHCMPWLCLHESDIPEQELDLGSPGVGANYGAITNVFLLSKHGCFFFSTTPSASFYCSSYVDGNGFGHKIGVSVAV